MLLFLAILVNVIWIYLVFGHAEFWQPLKLPISQAQNEKRVAVILPARNEAEVIAQAIRSLLAQASTPMLHIFLVDDNSTDATAQRASEAAAAFQQQNLTIINGSPLPYEWSGKVWAMQQGWDAVRASGFTPDYLLLTDADIFHAPHSLAQLVAHADSGGYDLTSLMVRLHCESIAEKLLVPAFVYFFFLLYPPKRITSRRSKVAGAAGGCILIKPDALERAGGFAAIRNEIIDDCALARRVKQSGGNLWLGLAEETRSIRPYEGYSGIRDMIARTAFNQLHHSWLLLSGCILGLVLTFIVPIALLFVSPLAGTIACVLMFGSYVPLVRNYGLSAAYALTLPIAALFYLYATMLSAVRYFRGRGGAWKGRMQDNKQDNK